MIKSAPLVGMHHRAPAKAILQCLPADTKLILEPEPENPFDPNAIKVLVAPAAVPQTQHTMLETLLLGYGYSMEHFLEERSWHLGYIKAQPIKSGDSSSAAEIAPILGDQREATLRFDHEGKPWVDVQVED